MARKTARSGRTLALFFLGLAIAYALVALAGEWKPALGLDLQGGTRMTLIADGHPSAESLNDARSIIDQRVNGSGVTEASVSTQSGRFIVVEIPGKSRADLIDKVSQTAKLRFRLVACSSSGCGGASASSGTGGQGDGSLIQQTPTGGATGGLNRPPFGTAPAAATTSPSPSPATGGGADGKKPYSVKDATTFMRSVPAAWQQKYDAFQCPTTTTGTVQDDPTKPLLTCDDKNQQKYLLTPSIIEGTQIKSASYGIPQNGTAYAVMLDFKSEGNSAFADATGAIAGTGELFAITLDGSVISAATAEGRISGGAQITGNFTQASAKALSTNLKYGSLPISFKKDPSVETIGPSLAGDQLSAGLIAGAVGLGLVMLYCLIYYRGLGLVVLSSLVIAGAWTYALVLLLSKTAGFTLTLPGIAGLIIAVGITADSFVIFFERIRDEMREGKSMRVAVESGWVRARRTRIASSVVSLLSAVVLYVFATGVVKGFGFALGLSTLIDLAVIFWFTKPIVTTLAKLRFFRTGHKYSGLSREAVGIAGGLTR